MRLQNTFLFFMVDSMGRSAYWEDEVVKWSTEPRPLRFSPDGWKDTQVSFVRSQKYFGINRQFTNSYKFVEDGGSILRYLVYTGQSYETKLYLIVTKWNDLTDIYETYYRGEIDLVKMQDDPVNGVTANMVEGDLLKLLNADDDTEFEIPITGFELVQMDPVTLANVARYSFIEEDRIAGDIATVVFLSVDQTLPGFIYQGQNSIDFDESANEFIFYSELAQEITIAGSINVKPIANAPFNIDCYVRTGASESIEVIYAGVSNLNNTVYQTINFSHTFTVPANSSIMLFPYVNDVFSRYLSTESALSISFDYNHPSSLCKAIKPKDLLSALMTKISGTHPFVLESTLLDDNEHLLVTSGLGLREVDAPVIKTSLAKFFDSYNKILFAAFGISGMNVSCETRQDFYDSSTNTLDLGEVSELNITVADDQLMNVAKIGYPVQDIETLNGKYSFNNTSQFSLPVNKIKKEYDQVSTYLTDPYVIENIRANFLGKDTTDNKNDNSTFILNTVPARAGFTGVGLAYSGIQGYQFLFPDTAVTVSDFPDNSFFIISGSTTGIDGGYRVVTAVDDGSFVRVTVSPGTSDEVVISDTADIEFPTTLKKLAYSSITGVPENSNVYNIEQLTPKRMLNAHAPYYRSLLYFLSTEKMVFNTADRNQDLVTVLDGVTVTENADVRADTLGTPLFYPFVFSFKTRVPETFNSIFQNAVNGHIAFQFNGINLYGFPLQMNAKPALNESQEWKLLASPANDISAMFDLLANPLNTIEMSTYGLSFSKLCPVQMVPQGIAPLPPYNFLHMDMYSYAAQSGRYDGYRPYLQKWQTTDNIALQCITRDLGPVQVELINAHERVFGIYPLAQIVTTAVTSPYQLFEGDIPLLDIEPGIYWLRAVAGIGDTKVTFLSEPQCIQDEHPKTLYFEYSNTRNQAATIFSTGYAPAIRVEGNIINFSPRSRFAAYEDEPANMYLLDGTPYRQFTLWVGDSFGLPPYMADKINRVFTLNTVSIDGKGFVRGEDAQLEPVARTNGMPGTWWTMEIREALNQDATSQDIEGVVDGGAILVNVDAALFGDLTDQVSSNPIQITVLQDN